MIQEWNITHYDQVSQTHLQHLLAFEPSIILLGTGKELILPQYETIQCIYKAGIGCEVMSTSAACRTYTILMSENRKVLAALIISS